MSNAAALAQEISDALAEASSAVGAGVLQAFVIRRGDRTGPEYAPTYGPDVAFACNAGISSSTRRHEAQTLIQQGDKSIMLSALSVTPTPADRVQVGGMIYEIANVMSQEFGGQPYLYDVLVTGGKPDSTVYPAGG